MYVLCLRGGLRGALVEFSVFRFGVAFVGGWGGWVVWICLAVLGGFLGFPWLCGIGII